MVIVECGMDYSFLLIIGVVLYGIYRLYKWIKSELK